MDSNKTPTHTTGISASLYHRIYSHCVRLSQVTIYRCSINENIEDEIHEADSHKGLLVDTPYES